ncbi:ATP-dependent DNA ligase [Pseudonocardia sp. TRM90224]|uniref:ATP-dependent DNA ligase n=1 Tax=Pseudonocardia sp. TRM90224 TaxID=2812678 RepID=UPI001E483C2F|nr:histidine kinase [Pseudonocardia sp. TRM90224]
MHASAGSGMPPTGPDWVVELAWTGHRCIAYVEPGRRVRLLSANAVSMTSAYPELGPPLERRSPPRGMVLDGTLVARGEEHAPRARLLQRRSGRMRPTDATIRNVPVDFQVADLLWLDGHSTLDLPYRDRRALLEGLGFDAAPVWATSPLPVSELDTMLRIADAKGVDALHARHLGSRYRPGGRSPLWVKVPVPRVRQVVVGGWTPTDIARPDTIASLLLGVPDGERLAYVGRVGVAGDERRQVSALTQLRAEGAPFAGDVPVEAARHAIWVAPRLVGLVEFTGFVAGGRLRLPRWRGLVTDGADGDESPARWARPPEPPPQRTEPAVQVPDPVTEEVPVEAAPMTEPAPVEVPEAAEAAEVAEPPASPESRRLEQHFVYNALNTIAALIRTDPGRARELLFGFADLSRAADQAATIQLGDAVSTLGSELDAVRAYLQLEQARFGKRLRVELDVDAAVHGVRVEPMRVLSAVRAAVQRDIEPRAQGGVLTVSARQVGPGCEVRVIGGAGEPVVIALTQGRSGEL